MHETRSNKAAAKLANKKRHANHAMSIVLIAGFSKPAYSPLYTSILANFESINTATFDLDLLIDHQNRQWPLIPVFSSYFSLYYSRPVPPPPSPS